MTNKRPVLPTDPWITERQVTTYLPLVGFLQSRGHDLSEDPHARRLVWSMWRWNQDAEDHDNLMRESAKVYVEYRGRIPRFTYLLRYLQWENERAESPWNLTQVEELYLRVWSHLKVYWERWKESGGDPTADEVNWDMEEDEPEADWLVEDVLVRGESMVVGGPEKSCKTNMLVDLAISLASGTPFLGYFKVPEAIRVLMLSGESGEFTLASIGRRITRSKGLDAKPNGLAVSQRLPQLSSEKLDERLSSLLSFYKPEVVMLDPLYLTMFEAGKGGNAGNLYEMGPILARYGRVCNAHGCTPIIAHHAKKRNQQSGPLMKRQDLAFSGLAEWARQWWLVNRVKEFNAKTGTHDLTVEQGGSYGHSGQWSVQIVEGPAGENGRRTEWDVTVNPYSANPKENSSTKTKSGKSNQPRGRDRVTLALRELVREKKTNEVSRSELRKRSGIKGGTTFTEYLKQLEQEKVLTVSDGFVTLLDR